MAAMEDSLTQMNQKSFRPRGLYCLIFTYKSEERTNHNQANITDTILRKINPDSSKVSQIFQDSGRSSGKTYGEVEMPEATPLTFSSLDEIEDIEHQSSMKRKGKFVAHYFNKRARAAYTVEDPDSTLVRANPAQHKFASRYADPYHPVNSGHPISLLAGVTSIHLFEEMWVVVAVMLMAVADLEVVSEVAVQLDWSLTA